MEATVNGSSATSISEMSHLNGSLTDSQYLSSSNSSIPIPRRGPSEVSKAYNHASQLYLTRRLSEALSVLEPLITPVPHTDRPVDGEDDVPPLAPIADATPSQRIKVWSLYVTTINSIIDLGSDEGTRDFGQKEWRAIVSKARDGGIWEQVVRDGYGGKEGVVDAEVVYNLATLLLGQASSQTLNQSRLENYLLASSQPDLDVSFRLAKIPSRRSDAAHTNGASTPRDLNSRLKIVELFTLHVLPRNEEWEFARSFISNSDILDEERRETFLQTLQEIQKANDIESETAEESQAEIDAELQRKHAEGMRRVSEARRNSIHQNGATRHRRSGSEVDYGIEKAHPTATEASTTPPATEPQKSFTKSTPPPATNKTQLSPTAEPPRHRNSRKSPHGSPRDLLSRAKLVFRGLQSLVRNMAGSITGNPTAFFQATLLLLAVLMAFSRREVREKAMRIVAVAWEKIRRTVGMGVKVSYI